MKTRILASAVLVPLLLLLVLALPKILSALVMGLLMAIAAYELLYGTGLVQHPRLVIYAAVMAFAVSIWSYAGAVHAYWVLLLLVYTMVLFAEMMNDHVKVRFSAISACMIAGVVVPYLLTALLRILTMKIGRYVIMVPFVVAFFNDAGAYFVGMKFGKHKLAPVVSPNKTIEGMAGGMIAATVGMLIYCLVLYMADFHVNVGLGLLYGILGSAAGVFGDLCFSIIKRQTGIKDYGNLIPGHGGVLDRMDSLVTVAPLMEVLLLVLPFAVG